MGWWTKQCPPTQMNYPNMHQPFNFFCFDFVGHNKHHEIYSGPSDVTFFNIGPEVSREIDNIKCPSVYRLTQIQNVLIGLAHPF